MQDTNPNRQNDHRGLLDDLAASAGCLYVSDLRGEQNYASERAFVEQSGAEDYTLREWRDAIGYLSGRPSCAESCAEARQELLSLLNRREE